MPQKLNSAGQMQNYVPAGHGDASGEYGDSEGNNIHFKMFKKPKQRKVKEYWVWSSENKDSSFTTSKKKYEESNLKKEIIENDFDYEKYGLTEQAVDDAMNKDYDNINSLEQLRNAIASQIKMKQKDHIHYRDYGLISELKEEIQDIWEHKYKSEVILRGHKALAVFNRTRPNDYVASLKYTNERINDASEPYMSYNQNCQRCCATFEARIRGYDVRAKKRVEDDTLQYGQGYSKCFVDPVIEDNWDNHLGSIGRTFKRNVENVIKKAGNGARFIIRVDWQGVQYGHVFMGINENGEVRFVDPQTNENDVSRYFNSGKIHVRESSICRIDNLNFNDRVGDYFEKMD